MPEAVYRVVTLLCSIVKSVPVGTNLGLVEVLWMLVSGRLLATRGALIPGLAETGLPDAAVRRAWRTVRTRSGCLAHPRLPIDVPARADHWLSGGVPVPA